MPKEAVTQLLADSRLAFLNQQNGEALRLAQKAIKLEFDNSDAYKCAGNALMSLERYDEAIKNYKLAVKYDASNGNRYYDLGFALATTERLADALENLAKADELGCIPENAVQLYNLLGIICFDIGRYDDALVNLGKAQQLIGVNLDILQRKAIIYGIKNDIRRGLQTANQIKLVAPSDYMGYKIAFKLLVQGKRLDIAETELKKAEKYVEPTMDFYFDKMTLELEKYNADKDRAHFCNAVECVSQGIENTVPNVESVTESYINAAELYLQLENADKTIECLDAAQSPVEAYNNGFAVIDRSVSPPAEIDDFAVEEMMEQDREKMENELGEYGLEELAEYIEPDEDGRIQFLTEVEAEPAESPKQKFKLDENTEYELSSNNKDQINRLYIGAYTLKKDYQKVLEYSKVLQASETAQNVYIGKYAEANALKESGSSGAQAKYEEIIKFFRNAMIKDPTDISAVTFRIRCYVDLKRYDEAEELCSLLAKDVSTPLLEKIAEAKDGGE